MFCALFLLVFFFFCFSRFLVVSQCASSSLSLSLGKRETLCQFSFTIFSATNDYYFKKIREKNVPRMGSCAWNSLFRQYSLCILGVISSSQSNVQRYFHLVFFYSPVKMIGGFSIKLAIISILTHIHESINIFIFFKPNKRIENGANSRAIEFVSFPFRVRFTWFNLKWTL